jgi:hypothetical protein
MSKCKSALKLVLLFTALLGMVLVIGCAGSSEKKELSDSLKLYSEAVNEYEAADDTQRAQVKEKVDSYKLKCSKMINELVANDNVTPQTMRALEKEYKEITAKYTSLIS